MSDSGDSASQDVSSAVDKVILEYLHKRGFSEAQKALLEALESDAPDERSQETEIAPVDFIKSLAVYAQKASKPGENVLKESANVLQEITAMDNPINIQNLIESIGAVGAEEILSQDPNDRHEGFKELESWVDGSLDMYRVCYLGHRFQLHIDIKNTARISSHSLSHILSLLLGFNLAWFQRCRFVNSIIF